MDGLEVPLSFACHRVQCQHAVAEQVGADAVAAIEVEGRRADAREHDAALHIQAHAGPVVGAADMLVGVRRPGLVAVLARPRRGVEDPAAFAGLNVKGPDMSRGLRIGSFSAAPSDHDQVLVGHHRTGTFDRNALHFAIEILVEVNHSVGPKRPVGLAVGRVQAVQPVLCGTEYALLRAVFRLPIAHSPTDAGAAPGRRPLLWVERPQQLPTGSI